MGSCPPARPCLASLCSGISFKPLSKRGGSPGPWPGGQPVSPSSGPPSPPQLVDKSLVGAAMGSLFPCWGTRGVCTVPLILWVPSRLEAETEPGLHLSPSGPAFFCASYRVLSTSPCPTPRPPESGGVPVE